MLKNVDIHRYMMDKLGCTFNRVTDSFIFSTKGVWTEDEYFMRVFKWAQKEHFWGHFKDEVIGVDDGIMGALRWPISEEFIDCDMFIKNLYDFLLMAELVHEGYVK